MPKIEILAPVGSEEMLRAAVFSGADAVYLGFSGFNARTGAGNFDADSLQEAVRFCHARGVAVHVALNTTVYGTELPALEQAIRAVAASGADAVICQDLAVATLIGKIAPQLPRHGSTQMSVHTLQGALELKELGFTRVVLARELSLDEIRTIRAKTPKELELETFCHGAMCVSYSGRCLLSNYLTDRHSNKGECSQPCRWEYSLMERTRHGEYFPVEETASGTYIMNSKDMCMIEHIPELIEAGVSSFKIEGRAKTEYYTAVVTNAYRSAVDAYLAAPSNDFKPAQWMVDEVYKISHRDYCTGFFFGSPRDDAQIYYKGGYVRSWEVAAIAVKSENGTLTVSQRNRFFEGDELEIMNRGKEPTFITVRNLRNSLGESVDNAPNPMAEFTFDCDADVPAGAFIRRSTDEK